MTGSKKQRKDGWYQRGYDKGYYFSRNEADYDELAAVYRAGGIPPGWDLFRAEILYQHLKDKDFDFRAFAAGFARACKEFYEAI
jgi:hypothetical protein